MIPKDKPIWGRYIDPNGLKVLYRDEGAPKKHIRGVHPPAGIDYMMLKSTDIFRIPGMGEYSVDFKGFFQVTRSEPDTSEWKTSTVYVNFTDLKLFGEHAELGEIMVDLNPKIVSAGNTFPRDNFVKCAINVGARFHIKKLDLILYNTVPIQLANQDVKGIPTIGEGGKANVFSVPLYDWEVPNGKIFGFVEEVKYMVLNYADKQTVEKYKKATSIKELNALINNQNLWDVDSNDIS